MSGFRRQWVVVAVGCAAGLAIGLFFAGRASVSAAADRQAGYAQGKQAGYAQGKQAGYAQGKKAGYAQGQQDGYFGGLRAGEAQGREEGRALQEGQALTPAVRRPVRQAFDDGYTAGANDAFAGYDGGWSYATPYVITVQPGTGQIVYRIDGRDRIAAHTNYYLCADGHSLCHEPRR